MFMNENTSRKSSFEILVLVFVGKKLIVYISNLIILTYLWNEIFIGP